MLSQLGHMLVGVADSVMVGQLGAVPLAGAALGNVIFHVLLTFGIGVSYAITPLVAAADGEGNIQRSASVLKHGITINLLIGLLLVGLVFLGSNGLRYVNQPEDVVELAIPYLLIITSSIIPFMLFQSGRQFVEGLSQTRQAMIVTIGSNVVNIFLNYVLIYGKLGFPALGLNGAGYATLISRIFLAIVMWMYIRKSSQYRPYLALFKTIRLQWTKAKEMLRIGLPAGLQFMFEVGAFGMSTIMIGWFGAKALAAHQIVINMASVSYMMASGLAASATIRVGNQLGKKDFGTLREVAFSTFIMVIIFMSCFAMLFIVGRSFLPSFYIHDPEVIAIASTLMIIAGLFQLSDGMQVVGLGSLRGLADVKIPTIFTFIAYWIIALPLGYILGFTFNLGVNGIWIGLSCGLTLSAVLLFFRFKNITKRMENRT
jgi:MATE family multidrug resistance protein